MRVVHICNLPLPPNHPEFGKHHCHPGRWVLNLAVAQRKYEGLDVEAVVLAPGTAKNFKTNIDGVTLHFIAGPNRFRAATFFLFDARRLSDYVKTLDPDVVHAHGTEDGNVLAAQRCRLPMVVTLQGCFFIINREVPPKWISRARIVEWTENRALKKARSVVAKSDYIAREVRQQFPQLTIHRIPNTFDERLLEFPLDTERDGFAFVGMVTPRKGLDLLADAIDHFPGCLRGERLHIIGNVTRNPGEYEQGILGRLRELLGDKLVLHGRLRAEEAACALHMRKFLLAPSLEEMFGNQLVEAVTLGVWPVVSSDTAMEENVARFGAGEVFRNGNFSSLLEAIERSWNSVRDWCRSDTRLRVIDEMGPSVVASEHLKLYKSITFGEEATPKSE